MFSFAATNVFLFFVCCTRDRCYVCSVLHRVVWITCSVLHIACLAVCLYSLNYVLLCLVLTVCFHFSWVHLFVVSLCMFYSFVFHSGPRLELRSYSHINQHFRFKFIPKLCPVLFYSCCVVCVCVCVCAFMRRPINRSCVVLILYRFRLSWFPSPD